MTETEQQIGVRGGRRAAGPPTVGVIGAGRAGTALGLALAHAGVAVTAVSSRSPLGAARLASRLDPPARVATPEAVFAAASVVWLAVPDDALAPLARHLGAALAGAGAGPRGGPGRPVPIAVHCAGRYDREVLAPLRSAGIRVAALHPLAAMARPDPRQLEGVVAALDADPGASRMVRGLARRIGLRPVALAPGQRAAYHAAAALAGSLPLVLLEASERVARAANLPAPLVEGLGPLLRGAVRNAELLGTRAALTGPAVRGDRGTLEAHAVALAALDPNAARLYRSVTAAVERPPTLGAA